ncbi:MAG TPA: YeeE/YedE thiosulfate transporter family protein [Clostridia bacterium]|nr:YeeE/YedE thiosulfate transporter family protein [Clostridia bacterium]
MAEVKTSIAAQPNKKKVNQIPFGVGLLIAFIGIGFFLGIQQPESALLWVLGVAAGFILQRARFCFTASLRDPVLIGSTSLTKAVVIAIATATVGFAALQFAAATKGIAIPGNVYPVGIHTAVGAILFGIGMVIAGGCASGTLMRVGEGFLMQMLSLVFFIIGSLWGAKDFGWWSSKFMPDKGIFIPEVLGWPLAIALQFAILLAIFLFADWFGNRKPNE